MRHYMLASCLLLCACSASASNETADMHDAGKDGTRSIEASAISENEAGLDAGISMEAIEAGSFDLLPPDNSPMLYNGGPVLINPINVYIIYYGDWSAKQNTRNIIEYMIKNIANTSLFNINTKYSENLASATSFPETVDSGDENGYLDAAFDAANYPDSGSSFVSNVINLAASVYQYTVGYPTVIGDADIQAIISNDIATEVLPLDPNGLYFVLTSADITEVNGPFQSCWDFCGWHNSVIYKNTSMKYSWVGDTEKCPDACSVEKEYTGFGIMNSPNGDWSADGMSNVMLHELSEIATDPDVSNHIAWMAGDGSEIGDSCAWTWGQPYYTESGSVANVQVGNKQFMLQQLWALDNSFNAGGHCSLRP